MTGVGRTRSSRSDSTDWVSAGVHSSAAARPSRHPRHEGVLHKRCVLLRTVGKLETRFPPTHTTSNGRSKTTVFLRQSPVLGGRNRATAPITGPLDEPRLLDKLRFSLLEQQACLASFPSFISCLIGRRIQRGSLSPRRLRLADGGSLPSVDQRPDSARAGGVAFLRRGGAQRHVESCQDVRGGTKLTQSCGKRCRTAAGRALWREYARRRRAEAKPALSYEQFMRRREGLPL